MNRREVMFILDRLMPLFLEGLTPTEIETIVARANIRRVAANAEITSEAYPANHLFLLLEGVARAYVLTPQGDRVGHGWFHAGTVIGVAALVPRRYSYLVSFRAAKTSWALVWDQATIKSLAATYPRLKDNALAVEYDYLDLYRILYLSVCCDSAETRLANVLRSYLAEGLGRRVTEGIELDLSNQELADEAHVTHGTISVLLRQWRQRGLVTKGRNSLVVHQPDELLRMGSGQPTAGKELNQEQPPRPS